MYRVSVMHPMCPAGRLMHRLSSSCPRLMRAAVETRRGASRDVPRGMHEATQVLVAPVAVGKVLHITGITASPVEGELLLSLLAVLFFIVVIVTSRWRHSSTTTQLSVHIVAPFSVVLLKAEGLDLLCPGWRSTLWLLQITSIFCNCLQCLGSLLKNSLVTRACKPHDAGCNLSILEDDISHLLMYQEAVEGEKKLKDYLLIFPLLNKQVLQHRRQPGARDVLGCFPAERKIAHEHDTLKHDVILGKADNKEAVQEVDKTSLALLGPRNIGQRHIRQSPQNLDEEVRILNAAQGHANKFSHPLGHAHTVALQKLVHRLHHLLVRRDMPNNLAEQRVSCLQDSKHDLWKQSALYHHLSCTWVRRQVHNQCNEVLPNSGLWKMDDELQQHHHAVLVVSHEGLASIVH
mmetsp:Transcript_164653/g.291528  ORF Transcript_164653/g.291528 Transcript_164653/m.291528 type:complete len:405 (+) Transcript_164653:2-1216(+)